MINYEYLKGIDLKKLSRMGIVSTHVPRQVEYYEAYLYEEKEAVAKNEIYLKLSEFFNVSERTIMRAVAYMTNVCP